MILKNALLVQPLSAAKICGTLNPDRVLSTYFGNISEWVSEPTNDVAILFTTGLYQNNDTNAPRSQRMSLLQREGEWRIRFEKLLRKNADQKINGFPLMSAGFKMASWDEQIASYWNEFSQNIEKLKKCFTSDKSFREFVENEIRGMGRLPTEANVAFLFEEIAVTALWLQGKFMVSKGLRTEDRLDALHIVYPSQLQDFMYTGVQYLLKDKKGCLPLVWLDTSNPEHTIASEYRFGRDRPSLFM